MDPNFAKIGVIAPSGKIDSTRLDSGIEILKKAGCSVFEGPQLRNASGYFAGSDLERQRDLKWAFDHPEINVIWFARGGYGMARAISNLNINVLGTKKKVIGFSDATFLLNSLPASIGAVHGPMVQQIESVDLVKKALSNEQEISWQGKVLRPGRINNSNIIGGNLSLLQTTIGTAYEPKWDGNVLMIEEVGEEAYCIDRMLQHLKSIGVFNRISGLLIGDLGVDPDAWEEFGTPLEEIIDGLLGSSKIPAVLNFPIGHGKLNLPVFLNCPSSLEAGKVSLLRQQHLTQ